MRYQYQILQDVLYCYFKRLLLQMFDDEYFENRFLNQIFILFNDNQIDIFILL